MTTAIFLLEGARWSGAARTFVAAARGLAERGWETALACRANGSVHAAAAAAGVTVLPLAPKPSLFGDAERLRKVVKDRRADVVFVHGEHEQLTAATAVWRAKRGCVVRRVCAGGHFTYGRAARAALRLAPTTALFTWADHGKLPPEVDALPRVVADVGVDPDALPAPVTVEADPIDAFDDRDDRDDRDEHDEHEGNDARDPLDAGDDALDDGAAPAGRWRAERRLVCVCEPEGRARTAVVLRAVAMLAPRHRELRLHLVGSGAADEQLRLHAAALGIHRLVRHVADRAADAASRANAHVGWVTAEGDDGAFGALDFMAAGVPVLADRGSAASRYVADAITGAHLTPGDVPATAAALAALLARDAERTAMGNAGRARLRRAFGEAAMLDGFARAAAARAAAAPAAGRAPARR